MKNKILVIEDDRAISELLCMNLEAAGYETVAAYDGEEAQRLLLWQEDADLAVVDIMLPGKDGTGQESLNGSEHPGGHAKPSGLQRRASGKPKANGI